MTGTCKDWVAGQEMKSSYNYGETIVCIMSIYTDSGQLILAPDPQWNLYRGFASGP